VSLYNNEKILIIDDDLTVIQILRTRLTNLGYRIVRSPNDKDALTKFWKEQPDLVVLDIILPKFDGYELCRKIRIDSQVPIIILTALSKLSNRIRGLELGADDYIIKPFSPPELEARIRSVLRRTSLNQVFTTQKKKEFKIGNLSIDMNTKCIAKDNFKVKLTNIEYSLLNLLMENAGKTLSRTVILNNIWGYTPERAVDTRIVDVHIARLRSKIEEKPGTPDFILTVRGIGYMFQNFKRSV
jgi:OmpR family response regulator RpaB